MMGSAAVPGAGTDNVLKLLEIYEQDPGFKDAIKALTDAEQKNAKAARDAGKANSEHQAIQNALDEKVLELANREKATQTRERAVVLAEQQLTERKTAFTEEQARLSGEVMAAQADISRERLSLKDDRLQLETEKNGLEKSREALKKRWASLEVKEAEINALAQQTEERKAKFQAALAEAAA